jgi:hypothetical protein
MKEWRDCKDGMEREQCKSESRVGKERVEMHDTTRKEWREDAIRVGGEWRDVKVRAGGHS